MEPHAGFEGVGAGSGVTGFGSSPTNGGLLYPVKRPCVGASIVFASGELNR